MSFSVFLSDFDAVVQLNSGSWWTLSFRQSTDAKLHRLSDGSAGGEDRDEGHGAPEETWDNRDGFIIEKLPKSV